MLMTEIIGKKRDKEKLNREEIRFFIKGYVDGTIPDYQVSALLMAIVLNGMDSEETAILTDEMMHSGETMDLSDIPGVKVDKHSTGGVGDKTSLVLGPMVAACGAVVAKLSGRGLGHTGGTLDKLESIPGCSIQIPIEEYKKQLKAIGIGIIGQTNNLVPADKKIYALRDVTGTVNAIPLIASSIMSKKLATGSDTICLDVKFGSGAFCKTPDDAKKLATAMVNIGKHMHRDTKAMITNMDEPLGLAIGNSLEIKEVIDTLHGKGPNDLRELCIEAGSVMLMQAKLYKDKTSARKALEEVLDNGKAYAKFKEFIKAQHGDVSYLDNPDKFEISKNIVEIKANKSGYIQRINTIMLGEAACKLGAGRAKKEDSIDFTAGIVISHKPGEKVNKGDLLATLYTNHSKYEEEINDVVSAFIISNEKVEPYPIVYGIVE